MVPLATASKNAVLVVLYSSGGTSDVGRHAVRAALDAFDGTIRVISKDPQTTLIDTPYWNCACGDHTFTDEEKARLELVAADVTKDDLSPHFQDNNTIGVISALGNRQPFFGDRVAHAGTRKVLEAMKKHKVNRLVAITSVGLNEDWPPIEFHWAGRALAAIFICARSHVDLQRTENEITEHAKVHPDFDYLLVRPVGISEERPPVGEWFIQDRKYGMKLGPDMSKLDCARFAVSEILNPLYHRQAVVVGSDYDTFEMDPKKMKKSDVSSGK